MLPRLEDVVSKIKKKRKDLDLSQKKLASICNVSQSLIAKMETGRVIPSYEAVVKIYNILESFESKGQKAKDIMNTPVKGIKENDLVSKAIEIMKKHGYSQLVVFGEDGIVGSVSESKVLEVKIDDQNVDKKEVKDIMEPPFPIIRGEDTKSAAIELLRTSYAVLVNDKKRIGIITKSDVI